MEPKIDYLDVDQGVGPEKLLLAFLRHRNPGDGTLAQSVQERDSMRSAWRDT